MLVALASAILLALFTPAATPTPSVVGAAARPLLPETGARARYALRIVGQTIGQPEIHMHPVQHLADGRAVRRLDFSSGISARLQRLYPADTQFVSILDADSYRPLKSVYDLKSGESQRKLVLGFKGSTLDAQVTENGESHNVVDQYETGMVDTISSIGWLAARNLAPGEIDMVPHHSTIARYRLYAAAEALEEVTVPAGTFKSTRVKCRLYPWPKDDAAVATALPTDREPLSEWTLWLTHDEWRTPVQLHAEVSVLGNVELAMTARRLD